MRDFLLLAFLFISTLQLNAQCEIPFAEFENWFDYTAQFNSEVGTTFEDGTVLYPDENASPFFRIFSILFGGIDPIEIEMNTAQEQINEELFGFDRTEESRNGDYALKMGGDSNLGESDIIYIGSCEDVTAPSYLSFYYKHNGNFNDSLYFYVILGSDSLLEVSSLDDDKIGATFIDSLIVSEEIDEWQFKQIPVNINNDQTSLDSIVFLLDRYGDVSADNYFIIDDIQWNIETPVVDHENELVFQLGQALNNTEIYPYFNEDKYTFNSYSIYDQQGRLIRSNITLDKVIDISQYNPGTYYYKINAVEGTYTKPFIKI